MNEYVYVYCIYTYLRIYKHIFAKKNRTIEKKHVCVDVCMDIWIEKSQANRVLNEICTQLGMHRCKILCGRIPWGT